MKKIVIHLGTHKTGTSSIQKSLSINGKFLEKNGYYYPKTGRINGCMHHPFVYDIISECGIDYKYFYGKNKIGTIWKEFQDEDEQKYNLLPIISSEEFFLLFALSGKKGLLNLKSKLKNYNIQLLIYLRRQDHFIESSYNQNIKFSKWSTKIERQISDLITLKNDYFSILSAWKEVFKNSKFIVRPFEIQLLKNNSVVDDFYNTLGIDNDNSMFKQTENENEQIPLELVEFKRCINRVHYKFPEQRENINKILLTLDYYKLKVKPYFMSCETYDEISQKSKMVNQRISEKFLNGEVLFKNNFKDNTEIIFHNEINFKYEILCESVLSLINSDMIELEYRLIFLHALLYFMNINKIDRANMFSVKALETLFILSRK